MKLIQEVQEISQSALFESASFICESADKTLGQIYVKLNNRHRTLKQQDIDVEDLAKLLAGFRVLGKSDLRAGFEDISVPKILLRMLNDIGEPGQEKIFGDDSHKMNADARIRDIGETAGAFVQQYREMLEKLEKDIDDDETRESILRDIGKMRTFFEQARGKLKTHLAAKAQSQLQMQN